MATSQRYPSPNPGQSNNDGPFYGRPSHQSPTLQQQPHDVQEEADDLLLRADLARSLAPITQNQQQEHQDHESPHHYDDDADLHAQLAQSTLGLHEESPVDQSLDAAAKRKDQRQKVSRACDECRRKKIRCDAPNESASEPCSNCRRTNSLCAFSRQPMKRGPSKGYIKELAERLNALEGQMQPGQIIPPNMPQPQQAELQFLQQQLANDRQNTPQRLPDHLSYAPQSQTAQNQMPSNQVQQNQIPQNQMSPQGQMPQAQVPQVAGQKRTHDMFEASNNDLQELGSRLSHGMRESQMQYSQSNNVRSPGIPVNPLDGRPQPSYNGQSQPFFKYGGETNRRESVNIPFDVDTPSTPTIMDWDEDIVDEYYRLIHQTFPFLPHSKHRLRLRISECPPSLREAFVNVIGCMMRTFPSSSLRATQSYAASMKRAAELLAGYPFENPGTHTNGTNLVYLQILLLMALECDNHGPATMRGQAGPSRSEWLGRAAGVAGQLEINLIRPRARLVTEGDPDSEERLARRVWWVLFILDRWHASSTADLLKLPENSVILLPEDQMLLGESTYHLARLSFIIGHLAAILTTTKTPETNVMAPSNPASQLLGLTLAGEIDRFRESVESVWGSLNLVHLSYHHSHLLIKRLNPNTEPTELIGHALKVATVLNQRQTPITPLNHHFAALSAMTLCELVELPKTHADAARGLDHLAGALGQGRGLAGHPSESAGWDSAIRDLVAAKRAKVQGADANGELSHLTDAGATGDASGPGTAAQQLAQRKFDPTWVTKYGYLTALGQGMFQSGRE